MRSVVGGTLLALTLFSTGALAYEQRSGTFSIGLQGQLSGLISAKACKNCLSDPSRNEEDGQLDVDYGIFKLDGFDGIGAGLSIRFRYAIDRESAFGVSFEAADFERSAPLDPPAAFEVSYNASQVDTSQTRAERIHAIIVTADYYRYFFRKAKDTPYAVVGVGFYRPEIRFQELETAFPGSNLAFTMGGGVEHFFTRSVSLELSLRLHGLVHDGGPSLSSQAALGIRFYHLGGRRRG